MALNIYEALTNFGPLVALLLQARLLSRFLDARNRDYPAAIFFSAILFLLTSASHIVYNHPDKLPRNSAVTIQQNFIFTYAVADLFMHVLLLILMLQLIRKTLVALGKNTKVIAILAIVSAMVALGAYYYFSFVSNKGNVRTLLETRQVASFWMVLLNLYWWTLLLQRRQLDRRVLLLSAGIGLLMTGQVIGDGVMSFNVNGSWGSIGAALIMYLTHFACLHAWFNAFNPKLFMNKTAPALTQPLT